MHLLILRLDLQVDDVCGRSGGSTTLVLLRLDLLVVSLELLPGVVEGRCDALLDALLPRTVIQELLEVVPRLLVVALKARRVGHARCDGEGSEILVLSERIDGDVVGALLLRPRLALVLVWRHDALATPEDGCDRALLSRTDATRLDDLVIHLQGGHTKRLHLPRHIVHLACRQCLSICGQCLSIAVSLRF